MGKTVPFAPGSFNDLNVVALYDVLADILGEAHGAKIKYTVVAKEDATKTPGTTGVSA